MQFTSLKLNQCYNSHILTTFAWDLVDSWFRFYELRCLFCVNTDDLNSLLGDSKSTCSSTEGKNGLTSMPNGRFMLDYLQHP
mmetsp:Transcript_28528/g.68007  ORF Transcript_28528/g.68007 Transcript_28528/m.68007 type:complete len:82 (-) Transcript_28528:2007-2252(-)